MIASRSESAILQSDFYRLQFRRLLRWLIYAIAIIYILIAGIIYIILFQAPQIYYANTAEGKILMMPRAVIVNTNSK